MSGADDPNVHYSSTSLAVEDKTAYAAGDLEWKNRLHSLYGNEFGLDDDAEDES